MTEKDPSHEVASGLDSSTHGLLAVILEVGRDDAQKVRGWYDQEHLPERLRIPGILAADRWIARSSTPGHVAFLTLYSLSRLFVLISPPYQALKNAGDTAWTTHIKRLSSNLVRHEFDVTYCTERPSTPPSPTCLVIDYPGREPSGTAAAQLFDEMAGFIRWRTCQTLDRHVGWHLLEFDGDLTQAHHDALEDWAPGSRRRSFTRDLVSTEETSGD